MSTKLSAHTFVPKDLEEVTLDRNTLSLYPKITASMNTAERQYALLTNTATLETASIGIHTRLQALGLRTDSLPLLNVIKARILGHAKKYIFTAGNFTVLSYHGKNGVMIANCMENNGDLKATSSVAAANRRPAGIQFVKLACNISFTDINPADTRTHLFTFFVRLHCETRQVLDGNNNNMNLKTFHGPNDWARSAVQAVVDGVIYGVGSLRQPFYLSSSKVTNDTNADALIDKETCVKDLETLALTACWNTISTRIFKHVCPNVEQDPITVIQECHQSGIDSEGNEYSLNVEQYYRAKMRLIDFLPKEGDWQINVVTDFLTHLDKAIRDELNSTRTAFSYNPITAGKDAYSQMMDLQRAYAAALGVETSHNHARQLTRDELKNTHSFLSQTSANFSLADKAMKDHGKKLDQSCWGCGGDHRYATRRGEIICPNKDKPGVKEEADKQLKSFRERKKQRMAKHDRRMKAQWLRIMKADKEDEDKDNNSSSPSKKTKFSNLTLLGIVVLNGDMNTKPMLPIGYNRNLPHITMHVGNQEFNFGISVAYDTCAVLNVGNALYHLAIAKRFPQVVKNLIWARDEYNPIVLGGIVGQEAEYKPTTTLPAIIEYNLVYKTKSGTTASLVIALGNQVAVNTIIGFQTIQAGKFSLDLDNDVITSSVLQADPFDVTFKVTQCSNSPDFSGFPARMSTDEVTEHHVNTSTVVECFNTLFKSKPKPAQEPVVALKTDNSKKARVTVDKEVTEAIVPYKRDDGKNQASVRSLIRIPKPKWRPKTPSDWRFEPTDDDEGYEAIESCYGRNFYLRKHKATFQFPKPNPAFAYTYNDSVDRKELEDNIRFDDHLNNDLRNRITEFVKKYWDVFREEGIKIPIQSYEMVIDTGEHKPVFVPLPRYGMFESPVMQKTIDRLLGFGHIKLDNTSPWGFRITLAPKPHQEDCDNIEDYIWRFCINYIQLNRVTRPSEYPIPRCDDAVMYGFGSATCFILLDAFSGYHQIKLSPASIDKTAFHAPYGRKYVWLVMPFGLRNAPAIFIAMIHDLKALWTQLCEEHGIDPSENEGSTIIMDDCFLFSFSYDRAFIIIECVCIIARKYHLTWKLKKCQWFPNEVEFVGVDISVRGNSPATSKFERLRLWKQPVTPRDIMSFIGFAIFYLRWICFFEQKIRPLRKLIKDFPMDHTFTPQEFTSEHLAIFTSIRNFILSKPILQRADVNKRFYLKTDFSKLGLGWALCQPDDSEEALKAMKEEDTGGECVFDKTLSGPRLLPIAFGGRKTIGNEEHLHSHPGESLASSFGIRKNRHFLWGRTFTLMSDCAALKWLLSYDGDNHAVKRLQLELLGYWFTIATRSGYMMEDANYFSRLNEDVHIDPLLRDYLTIARQMRTKYKPDEGNIHEDNMPGRRKKKSKTSTTSTYMDIQFKDEATIESPDNPTIFSSQLSNTPAVIVPTTKYTSSNRNYSSYVTKAATELLSYTWCLYNPGIGHFLQCASEHTMNFECYLAIEPSLSCRDFLQEHFNLKLIKDSTQQALDFLNNTSNIPIIHGYYSTVTTDNFNKKEDEHWFFTRQAELIKLLQKKAQTHIFAIELHGSFSSDKISIFEKALQRKGWILQKQSLSFIQHSDKIERTVTLVIGLAESFFPSKIDMSILQPPQLPVDINSHLDEFLNTEQHSIPYLDSLFEIIKQDGNEFRKPNILAILKPKNTDLHRLGYEIYSTDHPVPSPSTNETGLFGQLFGISYTDQTTRVRHCRTISTFEYSYIFQYEKDYTYKISQVDNILNILRHTTPFRTSSSIISKLYETLESKRQQEIANNSMLISASFEPSIFLNGITPHSMPNEYSWSQAYDQDKDCNIMKQMTEDPSKITEKNLKHIHYFYRSPMRKGEIKWENERLIYYEPVEATHKAARLIIIPVKLRHHIFTAFHANPLGAHHSAYHTFHRIRLRYHWPHMYADIKRAIRDCAGCLMKKTGKAGSELLYSFPSDAPFMTITGDLWSPGKIQAFGGEEAIMITLDIMTGFAAIQPLKGEINSREFAKSIYKIMLRYGIPHLFISDPDSKFQGEFEGMCELLNIKHHKGATGNHQAILVERFNKFLNSSLRVFNNDRTSNRVFLEGAETAVYAWNSAPVIGTDLSRSLLAVGREFHFPIDYTSRQHRTINIDERSVKSFADEMLTLLEKSREVYSILINEHRAYHREYRNSQLSNPRKFKVGDMVFAHVQVQSKKAKGIVGKLAYVKRGPYKIIKSYDSGSYELDPMNGSRTIKKHGSDLTLSPKTIQPSRHLENSSDQIYSNLNKEMASDPFKIIKIKGYDKANPWKSVATSSIDSSIQVPPFPTVEELDDEFDSWPDSNPFSPSVVHEHDGKSSLNQDKHSPDQADNKKQRTEMAHPLSIKQPSISMVIASIIQSKDKLMFIQYSLPNTNRKEWKLVQIDLEQSMQLRPTCLQDGLFKAIFYIDHPADRRLPHPQKRYWIEYHRRLTKKAISENYQIIQPSETSKQTAKNKGLIEYFEWINFKEKILIHGPFEFAKVNNRQTRDKISSTDWKILHQAQSLYNNDPPNIHESNAISLLWNYPVYIEGKSADINPRVRNFNMNIENNDTTLDDHHG